jgi:hypothetical protein
MLPPLPPEPRFGIEPAAPPTDVVPLAPPEAVTHSRLPSAFSLYSHSCFLGGAEQFAITTAPNNKTEK